MTFFLAAALLGCHNGGADNDSDGNPNDTSNPTTHVGYLDATVEVLGTPEACQANILDGNEVIATDYTGDDELAEINPGTYTVNFGIPVNELFIESVDEIEDLTDGLPLHPDKNGDYWVSPSQVVEIVEGDTTPVTANMSMMPTLCPSDEDGCNGSNDEVGQWTCELYGEVYQDFIYVKQDNGDLVVNIPCVGEMTLDGNGAYLYSETENVDATYITFGWIEVRGTIGDDEVSVDLWVGRDGDDPR